MDLFQLQQYADMLYRDTLKPGQKLMLKSWAYVINALEVTNLQQATATITCQANADFLCTEVFYHANLAAAAQLNTTISEPLHTILVTDTGSSENWQNAAQDLDSFASNFNRRNPLQYPRWVGGRSSINVVITSYDAANDYQLYLTFSGVLIYIM